jgi:Flp pilus assembly protein CpaB
MEIEYKDPSHRNKIIVIVGLLMAVLAGVAAFYLLDQAQKQVQEAGVQRQTIVVAARDIAARAPIGPEDVVLEEVPVDATTESGVFVDPAVVQGLITSVPILAGQPVYANLLAGQTVGSQFSILDPGESVAPDSPVWRAVSLTVTDDRAVAGLIEPGQTVDVIVTTQIELPEELVDRGRYYSDRSTKIVYQDVVVLAKTATTYVLKATIDVAEELGHLQASGAAGFTLLLRPQQDLRAVDATQMGTTTSELIERYGFPIPEVYPPGSGSLTRTPAPAPSEAPASPSPSDLAAASPTPTPVPDQP